jgi:hypothetical protein
MHAYGELKADEKKEEREKYRAVILLWRQGMDSNLTQDGLIFTFGSIVAVETRANTVSVVTNTTT